MDRERTREVVARTVRELLAHEEQGDTGRESFAKQVTEDAAGWGDPAEIQDDSLNALWNFADSYCDARSHGFRDLDGLPWGEARSLLRAAVEHAERGEPITEPRVLRYRFPPPPRRRG